MKITTPLCTADYTLFKGIIEQGIDSHLEAFTESTFEEKLVNNQPRLVMDFIGKDIPILLRRLEECETDAATSWADDISSYSSEENA